MPLAGILAVFPFVAAKGAPLSYRWSPKADAMCWQFDGSANARPMLSSRGFRAAPLHLRASLAAVHVARDARETWEPKGPEDLSSKYDEIFAPSNNRNAASHLWAHYILSRANSLKHEDIEKLFSWFCPVSGSPLDVPSPQSTFRTSLARIGGGTVTGFTHHCCWPCSCDMKDLIKVDVKMITDATGATRSYNFTVIGDPCVASPERCTKAGQTGCLPFEAPAVVCSGNKLQKAIRSDGGHIIIGVLQSSGQGLHQGDYIDFETERDAQGTSLKESCQRRKEAGFDSGMGAIFQQVARLNPI